MTPAADGEAHHPGQPAPDNGAALSIGGPWRAEAEKLALAVAVARAPVVGIAAPVSGVGGSTLARMLCLALANMDRRALLLDLSGATTENAGAGLDHWRPGRSDPSFALDRSAPALHRLRCARDMAARAAFNNPDLMRSEYKKLSDRYSVLVLDLPALDQADGDRVNPIAGALACDQVYLVAATGRTGRDALGQAAEALRSAGAPLAGVVMNDLDYVSAGEGLARALTRWRWLAPGLIRRAAAAARQSRLLR